VVKFFLTHTSNITGHKGDIIEVNTLEDLIKIKNTFEQPVIVLDTLAYVRKGKPEIPELTIEIYDDYRE
jgi:hypothetical protein